MEPLRKLRDLIAKVDYDHVKKQDHREIYRYIEQVVLSPKSPIIKQVPPLEVIVYSIQNILSTNLLSQRIPDFLDLLATLEFYRKRTLDHARDAIVWNDYYKSEKTVITLSREEESFLRKLESQQGMLRKMYITILSTCCHLDLYNLWIASPPSVTDFLIRFNEYFPFLNRHCDAQSPRLFHSDLSKEEIVQMERLGLTLCDFAKNTMDWALTHAREGQGIYVMFHTDEFKQSFPCPCRDEKLSNLVQYFTQDVTSAAQGVQRIFN